MNSVTSHTFVSTNLAPLVLLMDRTSSSTAMFIAPAPAAYSSYRCTLYVGPSAISAKPTFCVELVLLARRPHCKAEDGPLSNGRNPPLLPLRRASSRPLYWISVPRECSSTRQHSRSIHWV